MMFSERAGRILSTGTSPTDDSWSGTSEVHYSVILIFPRSAPFFA
jgi:hypothetical protein